MDDVPTRDAVERALRSLVAELQERAEEGGADPFYEVAFSLRTGEEAGLDEEEVWDVVASYTSGHGPTSAYMIEDHVVIRLLGPGGGELVVWGTERSEETRRVEWSGDRVEPLVRPVREFMEGFLPAPDLPDVR